MSLTFNHYMVPILINLIKINDVYFNSIWKVFINEFKTSWHTKTELFNYKSRQGRSFSSPSPR